MRGDRASGLYDGVGWFACKLLKGARRKRRDFSHEAFNGKTANMAILVLAFTMLVLGLAGIPKAHCAKNRPWHTIPYNPFLDYSPSARTHHAMTITVDGSVWMFGGLASDGRLLDELFKLDMQEQEWHFIDKSGTWPHASKFSTMASVGNKFILFGGYYKVSDEDKGRSDELWEFDTRTMEFTFLHAVGPSARLGHAMASVGNKVFVHGGETDSDTHSEELWEYDVLTAIWTLLSAGAGVNGTPPSPRQFHAMTVVGDALLLHGGQTARFLDPQTSVDGFETLSDELWEFNTSARTWRPLFLRNITPGNQTGPSGRDHHAIASISTTTIILHGGCIRNAGTGFEYLRYGCTAYSDEFWRFDLVSMEWACVLDDSDGIRPSARMGHTLVVFDNEVIVHGGSSSNQGTGIDDHLWQFSLGKVEWKWLNAPTGGSYTFPSPRKGHAMTAVQNTILLFGGETDLGVSAEMWSFDPITSGWDFVVPIAEILPVARKSHAMTSVGNRAFLFGGQKQEECAAMDVVESTVNLGPCHFPFTWLNNEYFACTSVDWYQPWCQTSQDGPQFGNCECTSEKPLNDLWEYDSLSKKWNLRDTGLRVCLCLWVCMFVCVCERERERGSGCV